MTPARQSALAKLANAALVNLHAGAFPSMDETGALDAIVLWFASSPPGLTVMDAVVAGYSVGPSYQVGSWYMTPPNAVPQGHHPSQADAWRAALQHLKEATK